MRSHTRTRLLIIMLGIMLGWLATMISPACEKLWAQAPPQPKQTVSMDHNIGITLPSMDLTATLTENEELKLVNTYQAAIIAQVDYQTAKQRVEKATNAYSAVVAKVREDHKWSDATTFEINAETGKVTVHLAPANKSSQTPHEGTKEKQQ